MRYYKVLKHLVEPRLCTLLRQELRYWGDARILSNTKCVHYAKFMSIITIEFDSTIWYFMIKRCLQWTTLTTRLGDRVQRSMLIPVIVSLGLRTPEPTKSCITHKIQLYAYVLSNLNPSLPSLINTDIRSSSPPSSLFLLPILLYFSEKAMIPSK